MGSLEVENLTRVRDLPPSSETEVVAEPEEMARLFPASGMRKLFALGVNCLVDTDFVRVFSRGHRILGHCSGTTQCQHYDDDRSPKIKVRLGLYHDYRNIRRGQRKDTIRVVDNEGFPIFEVEIILALLSGSPKDRVRAFQGWNSFQYRLKMEFGEETSLDEALNNLRYSFPVPLQLDLIALIQKSEFEGWVGEWFVRLVKGRHTSELAAWEAAARRALAAREDAEITGGKGPERNELARVHAAVGEATLAGAGVPNQRDLRELLDVDGGRELSDESVRTLLKTLGFSWIPSYPLWKKVWLPVAKSQGWA